jgi:hypothetical protein
MIWLDIGKPDSHSYEKFFDNLVKIHPLGAIDRDIINSALKEYHATYHYQDVGNMFESSYEEWIEFKNKKDYIMFILRWS